MGSTDNADGTEGIFGARAHRDDSCPDPALTGERHLVSSLERTVLADWVRQAYCASLRIDSAAADGDGEKSSREVILIIRFPSRPSR